MKRKKPLTDKGFSWVKLTIVVAVMAILLAILVPQYLIYAERSRLREDNSTINDIVDAVKLSSLDANIASDMMVLANGYGLKIRFHSKVNPDAEVGQSGRARDVAGMGVDITAADTVCWSERTDGDQAEAANGLLAELETVLGPLDAIGMTSNIYSINDTENTANGDNGNYPTVIITVENNILKYELVNWVEKPDAAPTNKTF